MPLNAKQEQFCREYIIDFNATQAAVRAGYSERSAYSQAFDLLKKPEIQEFISELSSARAHRTGLEADAVLEELRRIVFFDPAKLFDPNGDPLPIHDIDAETRAVIAGVEAVDYFEEAGGGRERVGYIKKFRLVDKLGAIQAAMKHLGIQGADLANVNGKVAIKWEDPPDAGDSAP